MPKTTEQGIDQLYGYLRRGAVCIIMMLGFLILLSSKADLRGPFWSFELDSYGINLLDVSIVILLGAAAYLCCRKIKGWICIIPLLACIGLSYLCIWNTNAQVYLFPVAGRTPGPWITPSQGHPLWSFETALPLLILKCLQILTIALLAWGIAGIVFSGDIHQYILRRREAMDPDHKRVDDGVCPYCAYNLRANHSGKCPECGKVTPQRINELIDIRQAFKDSPPNIVEAAAEPGHEEVDERTAT